MGLTGIFCSFSPVNTWAQGDSSNTNQCLQVLNADTTTTDEKIAMVSLLSRLQNDFKPDEAASVLAERHTLMDLLSIDPATNLAVKSPFIVMNAAQRMLALIFSQGKKSIKVGLSQETYDYYPFFSDGLPVTDGRRVVGNEAVIATFVNNLQQQADGDRSAVSIPLLVGSHGTGKSELLTILAAGEKNLTNGIAGEYAHYTFSWKGLEQIPSLLPTLSPMVVDGKKIYTELDAPMADSPFTLLPAEVQKLVLTETSSKVQSILKGMEPSPVLRPDPASQFIRNEILTYYTLKKGHSLSPSEIVQILNNHVVVKRRLGGRMPIINAQPKDLDIPGLFFASNPALRFTYGPSHPMSWFYNGKFLTSHGNVVLLDEVLRNSQEFLDILLSAFESRVLSMGGSPDVPYDSVIIAATNSANLDEKMAKETGHAAVNRFLPLRMPWPVDPQQIASLLLLQKTSRLYQEKLILEDGDVPSIVKANVLDDLLPRRTSGLVSKTPDYRYKVYFGKGPDRVEIAPHTIMFMAEILGASRMSIDATEAAKIFNGKIVTSNLFRNPIDRLRLWEGQLTSVPHSEIRELEILTRLLHEGEKGISSRDAGRWFSLALAAARTPQYGFTLTPSLAMKTLREMLSENPKGTIVTKNHKERLGWLSIADEVRDQLLIPRIEADISRSLANGEVVFGSLY